MKPLVFTLILSFLSTIIYSQLNDRSWMLFDDTQLLEVKINMNKNDFEWMMKNPYSDSLHICTINLKNKFFEQL